MVETDRGLAARVKAELANRAGIADLDVEVDAHAGVIYLRGEVDDESQLADATAAAWAVPGVVAVRNQLVVLPLRGPDAAPEVIWVQRREQLGEEAQQ